MMKFIPILLIVALGSAAPPEQVVAAPIQRTLTGGFQPDPAIIEVMAGGPVEIDEDEGTDCEGYVTREPTVRLSYQARQESLYIATQSEMDTILMVRKPDGSTICNDDRTDDVLDAGLTIKNPVSGTYEIWVGTYDEGVPAGSVLRISEKGFRSE
jgi:hypothetical protein